MLSTDLENKLASEKRKYLKYLDIEDLQRASLHKVRCLGTTYINANGPDERYTAAEDLVSFICIVVSQMKEDDGYRDLLLDELSDRGANLGIYEMIAVYAMNVPTIQHSSDAKIIAFALTLFDLQNMRRDLVAEQTAVTLLFGVNYLEPL